MSTLRAQYRREKVCVYLTCLGEANKVVVCLTESMSNNMTQQMIGTEQAPSTIFTSYANLSIMNKENVEHVLVLDFDLVAPNNLIHIKNWFPKIKSIILIHS